MCCFVFTYRLAALVLNSSLNLQVTFPTGGLKPQNIKFIVSNSCQGLQKKTSSRVLRKYDNPDVVHIDNNCNDLANFLITHIVTL